MNEASWILQAKIDKTKILKESIESRVRGIEVLVSSIAQREEKTLTQESKKHLKDIEDMLLGLKVYSREF